MEPSTTEERIAAWADVVSLVLVGLAIFVGGLDPRRHVWGRSTLHKISLAFVMVANIVFSVARLILEGIYVTTGPREFLLISVIYSARWIWLFMSITRTGSRSAKAFEVACALRKLKSIRDRNSAAPGRKGKKEVVVRHGARKAKGEMYWRGATERVEYHENKDAYFVRLVEKEMHSNLLDEIGTAEFKRRLESGNSDELYKKFYNLAMTVASASNILTVDFTPFLQEFSPICKNTRQAERIGATDESVLGGIARRVAADACYYIWFADGEFRTHRHVIKINECIENAARAFFERDNGV